MDFCSKFGRKPTLFIACLSVFSTDTMSACLCYNAERSVQPPNNGAVQFWC